MSPRGPVVAITPLIDFHPPEFGSAVKAKSDAEWKLLIVFELSWADALIAQRQSRTVAVESNILFIISPLCRKPGIEMLICERIMPSSIRFVIIIRHELTAVLLITELTACIHYTQ